MLNRCWNVPYGGPGTVCSCGHLVEMHLRKIQNNPEGLCVECMADEILRLERLIVTSSLQSAPLTAEEQDELELVALRRLLARAHEGER